MIWKTKDIIYFALLGFLVGWSGNSLYDSPQEIRNEKLACTQGVVDFIQFQMGKIDKSAVCNFDEKDK